MAEIKNPPQKSQEKSSEHLKSLRNLYNEAVKIMSSKVTLKDKLNDTYSGTKEIREFLKQGGNPNIINKDRKTLLMYAAENNSLSAMKVLLIKGAQPDATDKEGLTAMHYAAQNGWMEAVHILLNHNANPTIQSKSDLSAYDMAVINKHTGVVKMIENALKEKDRKEKIKALVDKKNEISR